MFRIPGASGAIGVEHVAKSAPDGYTLLIATQTTHAANPALYAKLPYDAVKDFAPLTLAGSTPLALLVHPSMPMSDVNIPYKGAGPAMTDFLGGQVNLMFDNLPTALPHVKSGKLRALAVSTGKRSALAPELPTMAESGLAGFDLATWFAFFAPAATPRELVEKISADMRRALAQPDTKERLTGIGVDIAGTTPEGLAAFHRAELVKWAKIVKDSGAKLD